MGHSHGLDLTDLARAENAPFRPNPAAHQTPCPRVESKLHTETTAPGRSLATPKREIAENQHTERRPQAFPNFLGGSGFNKTLPSGAYRLAGKLDGW